MARLPFVCGMLAVALVASVTTIPTSAQASTPPADWVTLTTRIRGASDNGKLADLKSTRADGLRVVVTPVAGVPPAVALYTVAYVDYRLAADSQSTSAEQEDYAAEAEQNLRDAIAADAKFADAYGLLSAILGLRIGWAASPQAKMSLGPESSAMLDRAQGLEPDNPRVLLFKGLGLFKRPAEYGGDPKQAEALFRRAATVLDAAADAPWPNWGRFDSHVWLGQALAKRGDTAGARAEYTKALTIAPDSVWVKNTLLPAVSK